MVTLADGQYAYRGTVFGKNTDYPLSIAQIEGLEGFDTVVGDQPLPRGHGNVPGKHFAAARQLLAPFVIARDTRTDVETAVRALADLFLVSEEDLFDLEFKKQGQPQRLVRCRPTRFGRGDTRLGLRADPKVLLAAPDPRIYSAEEHSVSVPVYAPSGGAVDYPIDYPIEWASGIAQQAVATNAGNADAYPLVRFYGPDTGTLTAVLLENLTTGEQLEISATVTSGQILAFDGTAYVTGNGDLVVGIDDASRYGDWEQPRVPFRLQPGDNDLRFTPTGSATSVPCVVTWRDTSLS